MFPPDYACGCEEFLSYSSKKNILSLSLRLPRFVTHSRDNSITMDIEHVGDEKSNNNNRDSVAHRDKVGLLDASDPIQPSSPSTFSEEKPTVITAETVNNGGEEGAHNAVDKPYDPNLAPRYSQKEEDVVIRKLDWHLMPLIFVLYSLSVLDRSNLGNARISGMEDDIDLTGNRYDWLGTAFYISCKFFLSRFFFFLCLVRATHYILSTPMF